MASSFPIDGKVALVTGGARGIGYATAQRLLERGAAGVAVLDLDQGAVDAAAARLHATKAIGIAADVTDRGAMQRAVATVVERFGGLDIVMANAGIGSTASTFRAMSGEMFDRVIDVNLLGVVRTVDAALPQIVARKGHVVVVASVYAFLNGAGATPYAMSKAGVEQFGRAIRLELVPHGASASVAYFGFIDTEMVHKGLDEDPLSERTMALLPKPLQKRLQPPQAAMAVVRGIEKRAPRIITPRRWVLFSVLRGIVNPISDRALERNTQLQAITVELDARADQEQRLTL